MAINANYNLLIERNNSCYHIPEYTNNKFSPVSEEFIMQSISDFNQIIRESKEALNDIDFDDYSLNESTIIIDLKNTIVKMIERINKSVDKLYKSIMDQIQNTIKSIKNKEKIPKDEIEKKFKQLDRIKLLKKALQNVTSKSKMLTVSSINPTKKLMSSEFPNTKIIKKYLVNLIDTTSEVIDDINDNVSISSELVTHTKYDVYKKAFNNYDYDPSDISGSIKNACDDAFGSNSKIPTKITIDLYCSAVSNCEDIDSIIKKLEALKTDVTEAYLELKKSLNNFISKINTMVRDITKETSNKLLTKSKRLADQIQIIVETFYEFTINKVKRIYDIFGENSDSIRIKKRSHKILAAYINRVSKDKIVEASSNVYSGKKAIGNTFDTLDNFAQFIVMEEEMFRQNEYNERFTTFIHESLLLEADDPKPESKEAAKPTTSQQSNPTKPAKDPSKPDAKNTSDNKDGNNESSEDGEGEEGEKDSKPLFQKIMNWLKKLLGRLGDTMGKWKNRMDELVIKNDRPFWEKNKDKISKLNIADTKANQWYKFNIQALYNSSIVSFDVKDEALASDETFQESILKKINSNVVPAKENDTFTDRVRRQYEGEYINDEKGEGKSLSEIGYNHGEAFKFVDNIVTGLSGNIISKIKDDYNIIDKDFRRVNREYNTILTQMPIPKVEENPDSEAQEKSTEPTKKESFSYTNKYVLAERFGLSIREAKFTVGDNDTDKAAKTVGPQKREEYTKSKPLDDMIKRCFRYNTVAITARMTCVLAAYKQYMGLFKAVFDKGAESAK